MKTRVPDRASEARLDELRREAEVRGRVEADGIRPAGAPFPQPSTETGYYALPLLKPPVWTWEVPTYFFVGGAAGAASMIALAARITGASPRLVRDARIIAAAGANLSAPLLIADLGRPARFLYMMRIFKPQSPMSVGAWTLATFGGAATTAAALPLVTRGTRLERVAIAGTEAAGAVAAASGLVMATYTGVLLGATAIPLWNRHGTLLPIHFGASAVASASALLELRGHDEPALDALATAAATFETATGIALEGTHDLESEPVRHGRTGKLTRLGGVLSGPVPLMLRVFGGRRARKVAAVSQLVGSLVTRFAWVEAGKASARDPRVPLELDPPPNGSSRSASRSDGPAAKPATEAARATTQVRP